MFKILYLFEHLNMGGAEQLLLTTLRYLDRAKFHPLVYCIKEKGQIGKEIEKLGISVKLLNKEVRPFNAALILDLIHFLKKEKPDIVHTNLFFANVYGRLACKMTGIKTVITTLHNPDYTYEDNGRWTFKMRKAIDRYSAKLSHTAFIAVSDFIKRDFEKQLKFENIRVLYNCIEASRFKRPDASLIEEKRNELGVQDGDILILNVGRLHPQKGQDYLIEAFNLVRRDNPQCRLIIIGKGVMEVQLKKQAAALGLEKSTIFLKDRRDIPEIMSACDIFAFSSLYEGFGIALVEAMAAGLAIVSSDLEPLREIVRDGKEAVLVEKANPKAIAEGLKQLIYNKEQRSYLGENARKRAHEAFDVAGHLRNLENIYQELSGKRHSECLVCGKSICMNTIYGGYNYKNKIYSIVRCVECGFMFLDPLPAKEVLDDIYTTDNYFDNYYVTAAGKKGYIEAMADYGDCDQDVLGVIKAHKTSGRLLDVGCAAGRFLMNAKEAGFEVSGIEPNQKMVEYAQVELGLDVRCGTLGSLNPEAAFDIIHAGDVLEHILNLKEEMQILKALLRDEGMLVINQPLMYNKSLFNLLLKMNMFFKKNRYSPNPPTHLWEFNTDTLKKFLQNSGFKIIYYRTLEARPQPLIGQNKPSLKNIFGYNIKKLSSAVSNNPALEKFNIGDRAIVVCRKDNGK